MPVCKIFSLCGVRILFRTQLHSYKLVLVILALVVLQELREEIDFRLSKVNDIRYEPHLLSKEDDRLRHQGQTSERQKETPSIYLYILIITVNTCASYTHVFIVFVQAVITTSTECKH